MCGLQGWLPIASGGLPGRFQVVHTSFIHCQVSQQEWGHAEHKAEQRRFPRGIQDPT